ncbi:MULTISPECIES: aldose 1-epimerase [unclassified Mesorhizobium]|uniref:aldose 1-epimerase n=1 Tax=unclassified Mesorhizobium TaxID=325217 RepID=UPI00112EE2B2|nr:MULTISPECIES: aldose 1-epimerase [unclassified Mesorhizobium]MBZ9997028.1 aldose 1-epimerase [Mesorhizobium sp. BH1-1-4]TPL93826.1 aldose 1-epimerase [Mesorhizobium sp. B2-3-12]
MGVISEPLTLKAGALEVGLVPDIGGSVSSLRWRGVDLMRRLSEDDRKAGNVLGVAMFPMTPYANRIAGNVFDFARKRWQVAPNNPPEKYNVHGSGWQQAWTVVEAGTASAILTLDIAAGADPYFYRATQAFVVSGGGLGVTMTLTNTGPVALPFGFGLHPWFDRDPDVTLQFKARRFYLEEPDGVSGDPIGLPPELDFAEGRPLPAGWRNNDYGGWNGEAIIRFPSRGAGLRITADPIFRHLMLYADPTKPYFCVEPQTNASGAFNRGQWDDPEEGVIVLGPGESAAGAVSFMPFALQS